MVQTIAEMLKERYNIIIRIDQKEIWKKSIWPPGYDVKLNRATPPLLSSLCTKAQSSTIEVLVAMAMTRWFLTIVLCLAGGNASATCLKILIMRPAQEQ